MNPWDYILPLLGWILLIFIVFIITLVIAGIIQAITRYLKKKSGKQRIEAFVTEKVILSPEELYQETKVEALRKYRHSEEQVVAFVGGAEFMLNLLTGKEQNNEGK